MATKITLPKDAKLVYNLTMQNDISNKFYRIYTGNVTGTKTKYADIYTEHGRIGHTPILSCSWHGLALHLVDGQVDNMANAKIKKGYKKQSTAKGAILLADLKTKRKKKVPEVPAPPKTFGRLSLIQD